MNLLCANALSICCIVVAGWLAVNKIDGWYWFVGVAFLFAHTAASGKKDE